MNINTSLRQIANLIIGISIIFVPFIFPNLFGRSQLESTIIYASLGVIIFFAANYFFIERNMERFNDNILQKLGDSFTVEQRGTPKTSNPQVIRDILSADKVWNTFVGVHDIGVTDVYNKWLTNGNNEVWEDIVGIPEFFSERFRAISSGARQDAIHKVFVLRDFSHIINFIILSFPEKGRKDMVYFGWIANDIDRVSKIYSSTDDDVVGMFKSQFKNLKAITWNRLDELRPDFGGGFEVDHSYPIANKAHIGPPGLIDKSGVWETISFSRDESNRYQIRSLAVVKIVFDIDKLEVDSRLYNLKGEDIGDFTSENESTFSLNNLFFVYKLSDEGVTGLCHYKFFRNESGIKMLGGVFCDEMFGNRNTVVGFYLADKMSRMPRYSKEQAVARIEELSHKLDEFDPKGKLKDGPGLGSLWDGEHF